MSQLDPQLSRQLSLGVEQRFKKQWQDNLAVNIPTIRRGRGILPLRGQWKDKPAIVVGAGCSLQEYLYTLWRYRNHACIIVADRVGFMVPWADFVMNLDSQAEVAEYLAYPSASTLIASSFIHPKALRAWQGIVRFYHQSNPILPWMDYASMEKRTGPIGRLFARGTVVIEAIDFAHYLGASPIYLIGSEFCFLDGYTGADNRSKVYPTMEGLVYIQEKEVYSNVNLLDGLQAFQAVMNGSPELKAKVIPCGKVGMWNRTEDLNEMMIRHTKQNKRILEAT